MMAIRLRYPYSLSYNGTFYYYITNLQGDVMKLVSASGTAVATYTYDAWGNILSTTGTNGTLANANPLRYRGYYYDSETKLYYLQSRYYDPAIGRFINADRLASTGQGFIGCNMFAYCLNGPANYTDTNGNDAIILYDSNGVGHIGALIQDGNNNWWHFYWGTANDWTRAACAIGLNVPPLTWCVPYTGKIDLDCINADENYSGEYEEMLYLKGDFTNSFETAKNPDGQYNLYSNNCSQVTLSILATSHTAYSDALDAASGIILPKSAFSKIKSSASKISREQKKEGFFKYADLEFATFI